MFVFWKIRRALFSCNIRFEICFFALLLTIFPFFKSISDNNNQVTNLSVEFHTKIYCGQAQTFFKVKRSSNPHWMF